MPYSAVAARLLGTLAATYATVIAVTHFWGKTPRHRLETACYIAAALLSFVVVLQIERTNRDHLAQERGLKTALPVLVGCLVLSFGFFHGILSIGLLSDDFVLLDRAQRGFLTPGNELFRPGPQFIWLVTERILGVGAGFLHTLNVFLHATNGWLVFVLATLMGLEFVWALSAAGIFLLNPASVETVTWLSALFDLCLVSGSLLFVIGSLRRSWMIAFVGLALALLSKETAIATPILGVVVTVACGGSLRIPLWGTIVTAIFFIGVRLWMLPPPDGYWLEPSRYVVKELVTRVFGSLAAPWKSGSGAATAVFPTLGVLSIATIFILGAQRSMMTHTLAILAALATWVVVAVIPLFSSFFVGQTLEGARYLYLPSVGWSLFVTTLASHGWKTGPARPIVVVALITLLGISAVGVVRHQRPWIEAAGVRDHVLQSARVAALTHGCTSIDIRNAPDSVDGAYIFRNGIREALARANINAGYDEPTKDCTFEWSAGTLTPTEPR